MAQSSESFASKRVSELSISAIKEMAIRAAKLDDVASLTWGLPSFRTPEHIRDAVSEALRHDADAGKYTLPNGLPELREAVVRQHFQSTGISAAEDKNVVITAGNMQGIKCLLETILEPGDEVILTDPGFASHFQQIRLSGGQPVCWPLDQANQWALDSNTLEALISERTKALLLVTPSNPTGKIFEKEELIRVGNIVRRRGLLLILDDPYSHFTYENRKRYFNLASLAEFSANLAYLFTFSKCHAMSGWRLGYAIVPEELQRQMLKVHDAMLICAPRISQLAGVAALEHEPLHLREFQTMLGRRRNLICERLDEMPHIFSYVRPEGAYYVFPKIRIEHQNSVQFALDLLKDARVCVTPGAAFGPMGEGHVRMAFCGPEDEIDKAFDRIERHFSS